MTKDFAFYALTKVKIVLYNPREGAKTRGNQNER
jgi:hypothetical protein